MPVFCLAELQGTGECLQNSGGCPGDLSPFQFRVVVHTDPGEVRDLTAAKTRHPTVTGGRQTRGARGDAGPAGGEELPYLGLLRPRVLPAVHDVQRRAWHRPPADPDNALSVPG